MKVIKFISFVIFCTMLFSCTNSMKDIDTPQLGVVVKNKQGVETTSFKAGDTIYYTFKGDPENIAIYSGEIGYRYQYRNTNTDTSNNVVFSFSTAKGTTNAGSLSFLISQDFKGYVGNRVQDSLNLNAATWTDLSSRAEFATTNAAKTSGPISLRDYASQGKPVTLAFRYNSAAGVAQPSFTLSQIALRHFARDTSYLIGAANVSLPTVSPSWTNSPGWARIWNKNPAVNFVLNSGTEYSTLTTSTFTITGNTSPADAVETQTWLVSGPLNLNTVTGETGIPIKDRTQSAETLSGGIYPTDIANYTYVYPKPGTYKVVFLYYNSTISTQKYSTKEITLTITN